MKKLTLSTWKSIPPSLVFGEGASDLNIKWPEYKEKEYLDQLTEIPNRRAFDEIAEIAVQTANKKSAGFDLFIMDIDYFKQVNDTHGHQAGDKALQIFSTIIKSSLREEDFCSRIGGEEFAVITPTRDKVFDIGERIRQAVENKPFNIKPDTQIKVTCSFGCAVFPDDSYEFESLFDLADKALYKAKESGRNKGKTVKMLD